MNVLELSQGPRSTITPGGNPVTKRISILAIGHSYVLSVNRSILRELAKDPSFAVTVAAPDFFHGDLRSGAFEPEPEGSSLQVRPIPARLSKQIHIFHYSSAALRALLSEQRYDAVHVWEEPYIFSGFQIARAANAAHTPYCFWSCQNLNKRLPPPFAQIERYCVRHASRWIATGRTVFDNLVERGYPAERGKVIPLAVDTDLFGPVPESQRAAVREELGLDGCVIGYVGRLVPDKGLRILMQALERLPAERRWNLLLLGSGRMQAEIEEWARTRRWQSRIRTHLAHHSEVPRYVSAMDLLVAPSQTMPNWKEQFGRMLIEAFACRVPVIASDSGEIPFVVGDAGIIVPEKDVAAWTDAISRVLGDLPLRERLGERGAERVPRFSAAGVADQFRELYREVIRAAK